MPDFRYVSYEIDGHVATVTIRRPEVMNALHHDAHLELDAAWRMYESDPEAWVAILTGQGERSFCAGADLKVDESQLPQPYWMTFKPGGFGGLTKRGGGGA